jgi:hypothetical protein
MRAYSILVYFCVSNVKANIPGENEYISFLPDIDEPEKSSLFLGMYCFTNSKPLGHFSETNIWSISIFSFISFFTTSVSLGKGRGQHAAVKMMMMDQEAMPKSLSCDWSTRFMRVILLGLSLVGTNLQYAYGDWTTV